MNATNTTNSIDTINSTDTINFSAPPNLQKTAWRKAHSAERKDKGERIKEKG